MKSHTSEDGQKVVIVANEKGGVGKSTVAFELACALRGLGVTSDLLSLDPQASDLTLSAPAGYDPAVLVVDTPGRLDAIYPDIWARADLALVVTRAGACEAGPLTETIDAIESASSCELGYVLNFFRRRRRLDRDYRDALNRALDIDRFGMLPDTVQVAYAHLDHHPVIASGRGADFAAAVLKLTLNVTDALGITSLEIQRELEV